MNIALCFYGQPRFYTITHKLYYSKILEEYKPDVFIHTWWSNDMVGSLYPHAKHVGNALQEEDIIVKQMQVAILVVKINKTAFNFVNKHKG